MCCGIKVEQDINGLRNEKQTLNLNNTTHLTLYITSPYIIGKPTTYIDL